MGGYVEAEGRMASRTGYGLRTYRAFLPDPLKGWDLNVGASAANAMVVADRALTAAAELPQTTLGSSLADWMMARDESIRSSVMEGVDATAPGLEWARYMDQAGRPVSNENDALTLGAAKQVTAAVELGQKMQAGRKASLADLLDVHRRLFAGTRDRDIGGVLRDEPIWLGGSGCPVDDASFVPPPAEEVPDLMHDLIDYLNTADHPPVLQAAVLHAQFETIHPFGDGNGRTGRALIHTVFNAAGLTRAAIPISAALSLDTSGYHDALNTTRVVCEADDMSARSAAMHDWLTAFCDACDQAGKQAAAIVRAGEDMVARWQQSARFRRDSAAAALLDALPSMPVLDAQIVSQRLDVTDRAARGALSSLEDAGIVRAAGGRRNRRYTVPEVVGMLRRMTPDGGLPHIRDAASYTPEPPPASPTPPAHTTACGHAGRRSKKPCLLPKGHIGQHRYQTR